MMCQSELFDISASKSLVFNYLEETLQWNYFEIFIIFCNYNFGSTKHNLLIQMVKCFLFKQNIFSLSFHDVPITPLQGKVFFYMPFWNDCKMFTFSVVLGNKTMSGPRKHCDHMLILSKIKSNSKRLPPSVEQPTTNKEYWAKLCRLCCGWRGCLYSLVTLTHSLTHSTGQHNGFASNSKQ